MLREGHAFRERHVTYISNYGGLGDHLARLPTIKWIKETQPHVRMTVYWHDFFVSTAKLLVPESQQLRHLPMSAHQYCDERIPAIDFYPYQITPLAMGLVDLGSTLIAQRRLAPEWRVYPQYQPGQMQTDFLDPLGDFVVVTPCFTSKTRQWPTNEINNFNKLARQELGLKVVVLGSTRQMQTGEKVAISPFATEYDESQIDLNMINRGNLQLCLEIMARARAVVGVDNGLLHLSACVRAPSVWGFTSVEPHLRLPEGVRTEVVQPSGCRFCQSEPYLIEQDFRECMYEDYACTKEMTAGKFIAALKKVLESPDKV